MFFKKISFLGINLSVGAAFAFLFIKGWVWSIGIITGNLWVFLNSYCLYQLLEMGLHSHLKQKEKILIFTVLKFPVLYLTGFFILRSRFFPVYGLLLGVTLYFMALAIIWVQFNLNGRRLEEKSA